ncbi:MAG TPA: histidine kinase [Nocardioides sp.]|nr:histidine kinase [Nocardioides sp.]
MTTSRSDAWAPDSPDLAALTGIRSGKRTYYSAYQRSNERLQSAVAAMDSISGALVHTTAGPRVLLEKVVEVALHHLQAEWVVLVLHDTALPTTRPRFVAMRSDGRVDTRAERLSGALRNAVDDVAADRAAGREGAGTVRVPMMLEGRAIGALVARHEPALPVEAADISVLHILGNLAAVSLHTSELYRSGLAEQRRAQRLFDEVSEQARVLDHRTEELRVAEQRLRVADQRELLERERRRIALELHDSVAQTVLSAGLVLEVLRGQVDPSGDAAAMATDLDRARDLAARATEQLRSVIYALNHERTAEDVASLPELLAEVASQHRPHLSVRLRLEGSPVPLGTPTEHALARSAGEALFNVAMHAGARRAHVTLRYLPDVVVLRVTDDGNGDPVAMRRTVRLARRGTADGRHRGLVGMAERAEELGGTFSIRRARTGGVTVESRIPLATGASAPPTTQESDLR